MFYLKSLTGLLAVGILVAPASADVMTFNSQSPNENATTRAAWLNAIGIGNPSHLVDFESGFTDGVNIHGSDGIFPLDLVIYDTDASNAIVRSGAGAINNSNPVGLFALTQNEEQYLELDFSANPVDYVAFQDIDHTGTAGLITFVGGSTASFSFETTGGSGDSAEFFGIFRDDMPQIMLVQLDASGDGLWGIDNIEYGVVPAPGSIALLLAGFLGTARRVRR